MSIKRNTRLELTWIGKDNRPRPEPRILLENSGLSYHASHKYSNEDIFDNKLIQGDNLLALKALEAEFTGKIKCVFIDPPYNTGSAFTHYEDGLEHSTWLSMMRDRLEILKKLLSKDGSIWITIDDNEAHYLKVLCDEVFGRNNFIASIIWRKNYAPKSSAKYFSVDHDYILVYAKEKESWQPNPIPRSEKQDKAYKNFDNDPRGPWRPNNLAARNYYSKGTYSIKCPSGRIIEGPPSGSFWRVSEEKFWELDRDGRIWWGKDGNNVPAPKIYLSEVKQGLVPQTYWDYTEVGHTQDAKKEIVSLFSEEVFETPKPEMLMKRIIEIASNKGDTILDSFAGSGTTGAVAHKMKRRWIMIELGDHAKTHIVPRLNKVLNGEDPGGATSILKWKGGGGYRFYYLAPSLLQLDGWGNWVINKEYNSAMLVEAICKIEGFTYAPSESIYWQHGYSTETDYIYITTSSLSNEQLQILSDEVGSNRTLLVLCTAFRSTKEHLNLTVKRIPKQILSCCEWGKDDYSLRIESLPMLTKEPEQQELFTNYTANS